MWRAIGITDIHMAQRHTRYRADVGDDIIAKLRWVVLMCIESKSELLVAGDWFHSASVSYGTVSRLKHALAPLEYRQHAVGIAGQHDMPDHGDWEKGPAYALSWGVHGCIQGLPGDNFWDDTGHGAPKIGLWPFGTDIAEAGASSYGVPELIIVHAMIVPKPVPWDHITFEQFAELVPDGKQRLVFCGDYHAGFEPTQVRNLLFVNPGALVRVTRDEAYREPKYVGIEWDGESFSVEYHVIPHRPAAEVFDMTDYKAETMEVPAEMSAFVEQLQALDSDMTEIDVDAAAQILWPSLWPDDGEPDPAVLSLIRETLENARRSLGYE